MTMQGRRRTGPWVKRAGWGLGTALLVGVVALWVVPIWADRNEVILTFEVVDGAGGSIGAALQVYTPSTGDLFLGPGQNTTVEEGEEVNLTAVPDPGYTFRAWEGDFTATQISVAYAFYADSTVRAVVLGSMNEGEGESGTGGGGGGEFLGDGTETGQGITMDGLDGGAGDLPMLLEGDGLPLSGPVVWIDFAYAGVELGTLTNPYNTLAEGANAGMALGSVAEPATVNIQPGFSAEAIRINPTSPIWLNAPNGTARIGVAAGTQAYLVTVSTTGSGTVTGAGAYAAGTQASLSASASTNWAFSHWTGDLGGYANPGTLTVDGNKAVTAVFVQYPAYLQVTSATLSGGGALPTTALAGDTFTVQWNVTNNSANAASSGDGTWTDNVFLSRDAAMSADDRTLNVTGITVTGPIPGSGTYTRSVSVTIPDVSPGSYYLLVRTDVATETTQTASSRATGILAHAMTISDPELKP